MVGDWWQDINDSTQWQDGVFYTLCAAYALVSAVALVRVSASPHPRLSFSYKIVVIGIKYSFFFSVYRFN